MAAVPTPPRLLVSLHDVAPATLSASQRWVAMLDERAAPSTLLVVPGPWKGTSLADDPETRAWLWVRAAGGDEIGLHGWCHRAAPSPGGFRARVGRVVARGAEEFWDLDGRTAARRVRAGLAVLADADLRPRGFTPPGWLIGGHARHAVRACGLGYVADHRGAVGFATGARLRAPALSHRPNATGERIGAVAMSTIARRRIDAGLDVRIALHPDDLLRPALVATTLAAIDHALDAGAVPTTYGAAVGADTAATSGER